MKSIYLFDSSLRLIKAVEKTGYLKIHTLATQSKYVSDKVLIKKNNPFLKDTEFLHNSAEIDIPDEKTEIDYTVIELFRATQYKVEQYMARLNIAQYQTQFAYYQLLSYFYKRFKNNEIDAVFTVLPLHGSPLEIIPIDMALHFNKPVFTFDKLYANPDGFVLWGLWDYHKKKYVDFSKLDNAPNLNNYLFYDTQRSYNQEGKALYEPTISSLSVVGKIKHILKNLRDKNDINYKSTINSFMGQMPRIAFNYLRITNNAVRYNFQQLKKTVNYYKETCKTPNLDLPYVYYPLHLDPEASTLVREPLSNQLTIIKMLSDSLPSNYKIFVKEHPVVFSFLKIKNLRESWYFFTSIDKYRSVSFYKALKQMPQVELTPISFSSKELIKGAKAIATINGTVSLEAAKSNKPVLLFGDKLPFKYLKGVHNITSSSDCKKAFEAIEKTDKVEYNLEKLEKYLFELHIDANPRQSPLFDKSSTITKNLTQIIESIIPQ